MADDDTNPTGENENPDDDSTEDKPETDDDDDDDSGDDTDKAKKDPELEKAIKARDRAKAALRAARAELAKSAKKADDDEPDPVAVANTKIVRTAAHGILRGYGIEDKDDRVKVLDMLRLDDIEVDADGADEEAIEERLEELREILGSKKTASRVPRTVKTKQETKETNSDPDKARYQRLLGR